MMPRPKWLKRLRVSKLKWINFSIIEDMVKTGTIVEKKTSSTVAEKKNPVVDASPSTKTKVNQVVALESVDDKTKIVTGLTVVPIDQGKSGCCIMF